jgi:uroporphyrinogen-III synthase
MTLNKRRFGIINTRPQPQAAELTQALTAISDHITELPMITISQAHDIDTIKNTMANLSDHDVIIFVSRNAAHYIQPYWPTTVKQYSRIIAVGPSTAAGVNQFTHTDITPTEYSSNGILALPELQDINNHSILICCGSNHNPTLAQSLQDRGAIVKPLCCYQVKPTTIDTLRTLQQLAAQLPYVIITTSRYILQLTLNAFMIACSQSWIQQQTLLVITAEQVNYARQRGFTGNILLSQSAQSSDILTAIETWHLIEKE